MTIARRTLLGAAALSAGLPRLAGAQGSSRPVIRIGIMNDQSGPYRDIIGPTGVACARQAIQEFMAGNTAFNVEVQVGDHQNKADVASTLARRWIDVDGVDMILGVGTSSCALAVNTICREKNKIMLNTSAASPDLTGSQCSPNTVHWVYDTYMTAKSTGSALVRTGGDSWYFITANYVFGQQLQRDSSHFITQAGGRVLGSSTYPFPETTDFSSQLVQARGSRAKVLGLCNGGVDTVNCIKQAREFGIHNSMRLAAMLMYSTDVRAIGLDAAQDLVMSEAFYWDLNDRTRAFMDRIRPKVTLWPNMMQAGDYSATLHYLKAVADIGVAQAKADGAAVVARMKAMPTDDDCYGTGRIRADGRKIHPCYLFQVKKPSESRGEWDLLKLLATTPAEEAFRPMNQGGCSLVPA